jgi:putative transposase
LRALIEFAHEELSVSEQCALIGLPRSSLYYEAVPETAENLKLMRRIDEQYLKRPFFGSRQMTYWLQRQGKVINRKRVQRLMRLMGLEAIYPKPRTSVPGKGHEVYPYLLRDLEIIRPNQVWSADITYVPLAQGFLYLVAILDWYSRYVLSWRLSNSLEESFCLEALEEALRRARPEIFNTDQGAQFTGQAWTGRLREEDVSISMDGKGRALDNVFVERLWRTVKYEEIYLKAYEGPAECRTGLTCYFPFYNRDRPHQSLGGRTPWEAYRGQEKKGGAGLTGQRGQEHSRPRSNRASARVPPALGLVPLRGSVAALPLPSAPQGPGRAGERTSQQK